jgi:hypothetical protein
MGIFYTVYPFSKRQHGKYGFIKDGDITWYHLDAPDKIHNKKGK